MLEFGRLGHAAAVAATAIAASSATAQAQSIEDYVRMNCSEFVSLPLERQFGVLFWIDGYQSRTDGELVLDFLDAAYVVRDFEDKCAQEPRATLGQFLGVRF